MASIKKRRIGIIKESAYGVVPENPVVNELKADLENTNVQSEVEQVQSAVTTSGRRSLGQLPVGASDAGDISTEMFFGAHDSLLEGALWSAWSESISSDITAIDGADVDVTDASDFAAGDIVGSHGVGSVIASIESDTITLDDDISGDLQVGWDLIKTGVVATTSDITTTTDSVQSASLDFEDLELEAGQYIKFAGFSNAGCNIYARVKSVTQNEIVLDNLPGDWTGSVGTGDDVMIQFGAWMKDGETRNSYTIEDRQLDHSPNTIIYRKGHLVNTMSVNIEAQNKIDISFGTLGAEVEPPVTSRKSGATDVSAYQSDFMEASRSVGRFYLNGKDISDDAYTRSTTIEVNNNVTQSPAIGHYYAPKASEGTFECTGQFNTYFDDVSLLNKALNNEDISFVFVGQKNGQALLIDLPAINLTSEEMGTEDNSRMFNPSYATKAHATYGHQMLMQKFEVVF